MLITIYSFYIVIISPIFHAKHRFLYFYHSWFNSNLVVAQVVQVECNNTIFGISYKLYIVWWLDYFVTFFVTERKFISNVRLF